MARIKKTKKKVKKAVSRPFAKKASAKKILKKKASSLKKTVNKKVPIKKNAIRTASEKTSNQQQTVPSKPQLVEPGPPPRVIPPVEEPAADEEAIGSVTHFYSHLNVAIAQINKGTLRTGDRIHVKGHTTDFSQIVESMEYEHQHIDRASAGQSVGIKVADHARQHDIVYLVK